MNEYLINDLLKRMTQTHFFLPCRNNCQIVYFMHKDDLLFTLPIKYLWALDEAQLFFNLP